MTKKKSVGADAVAKSVNAGSLQEFVDWCAKEHANSENASQWYIAKRIEDALQIVRLFRAE